MTILDPRAIKAVETPPQAPIQPLLRHPAPCIIEARGLKKSFGGQVVLTGVDLDLRQGDVVLLRGENGSGKTTLLNILTGNLEPDAGVIHYGRNVPKGQATASSRRTHPGTGDTRFETWHRTPRDESTQPRKSFTASFPIPRHERSAGESPCTCYAGVSPARWSSGEY